MKNKIKTALTSFGMSGQVFHGPLLKVNPGFEVVHILERSKNLSHRLFPEAVIVRDYENLLNHPDTELVVINAPDEFHYEMAQKALEAGKHVIVEKPVTRKSEQAEDLLKLAKKQGRVLSVFQNRRWDGDFLTIQKILAQGFLGRLVEFESHYDRFRNYIEPNNWKEKGGDYSGVLYNLGSHMIDQVYYLFGKPLSVTAHLKIVRSGGQVNDYYDLRLEYEGFSAILKCSYLVKDPGPRYSLHGTNGSFHKWGIDPQEELMKAGNLPKGKDWGKEPKNDWGILTYEKEGINIESKVETIPGNYNEYYKNIYDVIRNNAELKVKPEDAVDVLKILEACLLSNEEKKTIFL